MTKKYQEDVLDLEEGLLSGSFDKLAILWDVAFGSSFLFDIRARHNSLVKKKKEKKYKQIMITIFTILIKSLV